MVNPIQAIELLELKESQEIELYSANMRIPIFKGIVKNFPKKYENCEIIGTDNLISGGHLTLNARNIIFKEKNKINKLKEEIKEAMKLGHEVIFTEILDIKGRILILQKYDENENDYGIVDILGDFGVRGEYNDIMEDVGIKL